MIGPLAPPAGTVARNWLVEAVKTGALTPPNCTAVTSKRLVPLRVTTVPAGPMPGVKEYILGRMAKTLVLMMRPPGAVISINPLPALVGTVAVICVAEAA